MGAITMRLRSSSEPSRYGVNNALIACPLSIVKPIGAAEIALRPFGNWLAIANDKGLNPSDFHQIAMDVSAMRQHRRPRARSAAAEGELTAQCCREEGSRHRPVARCTKEPGGFSL